jgi:hypothetical protein
MHGDPDVARRERLILEELDTDPEAMEIYRRYAITKVNNEEMKKLDVIYNSGIKKLYVWEINGKGFDPKGRPIIVVIGKNIPENEDALDRLVSYLVQFMAPFVSREYSLGKNSFSFFSYKSVLSFGNGYKEYPRFDLVKDFTHNF